MVKIEICFRCKLLKTIYSKGYCKSCYNLLHMNKEKQKGYFYKWKSKNKNYWKDYYLIKKQIKLENEN